MANAAPFIPAPSRRLAAGMVDLVLLSFAVMAAMLLIGPARESTHIALVFIAYAAYHAVFFVVFGGETPGLRLFDMRIVDARGGAGMSMAQTFLRAFLRPLLLYTYGWGLIIALPAPELLATLLAAPALLELGMMFTLPSRQTFSDLAARTLVVNVPPPQPHRAPAAPMYSATDAEFGVPPRRR